MSVRILVDADACPVKDEIYKVAWRYHVPVFVVSNSRLRIPDHPLLTGIVVGDAFDAADDWIAANVDGGAIVVTADILLADRCLKAGGRVLAPTGKPPPSATEGADEEGKGGEEAPRHPPLPSSPTLAARNGHLPLSNGDDIFCPPLPPIPSSMLRLPQVFIAIPSGRCWVTANHAPRPGTRICPMKCFTRL